MVNIDKGARTLKVKPPRDLETLTRLGIRCKIMQRIALKKAKAAKTQERREAWNRIAGKHLITNYKLSMEYVDRIMMIEKEEGLVRPK